MFFIAYECYVQYTNHILFRLITQAPARILCARISLSCRRVIILLTSYFDIRRLWSIKAGFGQPLMLCTTVRRAEISKSTRDGNNSDSFPLGQEIDSIPTFEGPICFYLLAGMPLLDAFRIASLTADGSRCCGRVAAMPAQ